MNAPNMRIATWNLERPRLQGWIKNPRIIDKINEVNADLWILTETNASIVPSDEYFSVATLPVQNYHSLGENFTTIWTKLRLIRKIQTFDPEFAVCVEIESPIGPMIIYGTIITYANDRGPNNNSKRWQEHRKSILKHSEDWQRIRSKFPDHHFIVGGDFNQSRDGSGWYEDAESVQLLTNALKQSSLVCVTEEKTKLKNRASIDHICISKGLTADFSVWEGTTDDNQKMSDHNGVLVDLRLDDISLLPSIRSEKKC